MKTFLIAVFSLSLLANSMIKTGDNRSERLKYATSSWYTNWNRHTVNLRELNLGGPPRDGIPSIDKPLFVSVKSAKNWIKDNEPVIFVKIGTYAKAYPIQILIWHEIVNDTLNGKKILVTFCPLCNSSIVFDRRIDGKIYNFGTSGLLRNSDLVMYDRQTESLWQQFTGKAIVGDEAGKELDMLPSSIISFKEYYDNYPNGLVLSKKTGFDRPYGKNPYVGYDSINNSPFLFSGPVDKRLKPMSRVVSIAGRYSSKAYPYKTLKEKKVINDLFEGKKIVIFYKKGTASPLDKRDISDSKDVGSAAVYNSTVDGKNLYFKYDKQGGFTDIQTHSLWTFLGKAVKGKLKGKTLKRIVSGDHFWFSFVAFYPDTVIY